MFLYAFVNIHADKKYSIDFLETKFMHLLQSCKTM